LNGTRTQRWHLGDFIPDSNVVSPSDAVINLNLKEQTDSVLKTLTPREERVIKMRFGAGEGSEHPLEEVGQSFAVRRSASGPAPAQSRARTHRVSIESKLRALPPRSTDVAAYLTSCLPVTLHRSIEYAVNSYRPRHRPPDRPMLPAPALDAPPLCQLLRFVVADSPPILRPCRLIAGLSKPPPSATRPPHWSSQESIEILWPCLVSRFELLGTHAAEMTVGTA